MKSFESDGREEEKKKKKTRKCWKRKKLKFPSLTDVADATQLHRPLFYFILLSGYASTLRHFYSKRIQNSISNSVFQVQVGKIT